ncbi:MAG: starch-binding outer membrane protein SusD/RagB family [Mucilaginibacter sp.]|nr:starch-binding outer membrane protein SusD/RagB family [Mucilaginibacter sp.]
MLKKKYIAALAFVLIAGCKKNPINVGAPNKYGSSTYPSTITQLQTVLVSCYANLRDIGLFGFDLMPRALAQSTHTVNSQFTGFSAINEMAANNLTVGNQYAQETWTALYAGIKNCNVTIYAANVLLKTNPSVDKQAVNLILGQAYCLRGWYYMELECFYGEAYMQAGGVNGDKQGVPLYTEVPQSLAATQVARSPVKDVWALIVNDEKQAATLLKGQVWPSTDVARATEWSAKGLLGKAYVYTQDWANAKTVLNDVITNSGKSLMPYSTYHNAFNGANKFNSESLLELYIDPNPQGGYGIYSGVANSSTINGLIWCPWTYGGYGSNGKPFNGTDAQLTTLGYANEFFHDQNVLRFGYALGNNYLIVPNPNYNAATGPTYYNQQLVMDPVYKQAALQARTNNTVDPRLYVCGLQPRVDSVQFDGTHFALVAKPAGFAGYGWSMRKYSPIDYNENSINSDKWDYYLLRLADVYLLYAEASIASGDNPTGLEYLNKVRRRAYSMPVNTPSAIDYKSLTDATPAANPVSPDPVLGHNPLYYERWAELFNEGTWWFDVCRWKIGASEAAYFGTAINVSSPLTQTFSDNKSYVWPIPLNETNSNSKIKQNPGY